MNATLRQGWLARVGLLAGAIGLLAACGAQPPAAPAESAVQPTAAPAESAVQPTAAPAAAESAPSEAAAAATGEPIVIGVSGPLTGNNAQYGEQWQKGFDLALDEINGAGGIAGRPLEYIFEDSQSDPKQSVIVAQKLVGDERVIVELGDFSSPASMAASPIYQRAGLVQFGFTNSHPDFTKGGDYMWSNSLSQSDAAPLHADYVKALGIDKIAVLHLNTDWGKTTYDLFAEKAKADGIEIVATEAYLPDEKDFRSAITNIRSGNPEGIVFISYYNDGALLAQQIRQAGIELPIVANGSNYSPKFLELGGESVDGIYVSSNFSPDDPRPEVQNYLEKFRAKYGEESDYFAAHAYDTMILIGAAIEAGGPTREGVKAGLAQVKDVPSVIYGKVSFNTETRRVQEPTDVRLLIKDGKFTIWDGAPVAASQP
jgi:branched-chain amino acid transport system substrate-binding protein